MVQATAFHKEQKLWASHGRGSPDVPNEAELLPLPKGGEAPAFLKEQKPGRLERVGGRYLPKGVEAPAFRQG